MPNFDCGTYFLTTLAPVRSGTTRDADGNEISWHEKLRAELAILPTAMQSPATIATGHNSPFARDGQTHFCRFVVIDDVIFNGRPATSTIRNAIADRDPIHPMPVDGLNAAYLLFAADIDAVTAPGQRLPATLTAAEQDAVRDAYARHLWATMPDELTRIYGCCIGFDAPGADGFAAYLRRAQVETTMPFHDYWISPPALRSLRLSALAVVAAVPALVFLFALASWVFGADTPWLLGWVAPWHPAIWALLAALATVLAIMLVYRHVLAAGARPMPPPESGDLPTVLKAMYLQQMFARFAAARQGDDAQVLFDAFGRFRRDHRPDVTSAPTHPAGTLSLHGSGATFEGTPL